MKACETAAAKEATPSLVTRNRSFAGNLQDWGGWHNDSDPPLGTLRRFSWRRGVFSTGRALWRGP